MPTSIDWVAVRAAAAFRLVMPRTPVGGLIGERLGSGTGSSLEFQEYRPYTPGDDLRHVDWAAYARSETLAVRLYRQEVAPRIDLVLDVSKSMAVTGAKHTAFSETVALLALAATHTVADTRVITTGAWPPRPLGRVEELENLLTCGSASGALEEGHLPLRRRSMRVVVSDFLFPHDPDSLVLRLARDSASLALVQLTLREEAEPPLEGGRRLIDVESDAHIDLVIDDAATREYRVRFARLRQGLATAARRAGARFTHVVAGRSVREVGRELMTAGILEAA